MWKTLGSWFEKIFEPTEDALSSADFALDLDYLTSSASRIRIVALMATQADRLLLSRVAAHHHWTVHFASTCGDAWHLLNESKAPIVLCDRELPGTRWRDVIQMMVASKRVYAVLVSRVADDYLWNEVIRYGGHDLLPAPLREDDLLRAVRLGWTFWANSMRMQPMLMKHYR